MELMIISRYSVKFWSHTDKKLAEIHCNLADFGNYNEETAAIKKERLLFKWLIDLCKKFFG